MSAPPLVPYTPIMRRHHEVKALSRENRHDLALRLASDPEPLTTEFLDSIAVLSAQYGNVSSFFPKPRLPRAPTVPGISNGTDLAWYLHRQRRLPVDDDPALGVDWVEYELSVLSTRGGAAFGGPIHGGIEGDAPPRAGRPLRADLVLANAGDQTPVIAEVKIRKDQDPFSALIQVLTYIAHLSTPSQYARLRTHLPVAGFPDVRPPRFDGYLLLHGFDGTAGTWLDDLMTQTRLISEQLTQDRTIATHIRRLACLDVQLRAEQLSATTHWRYDA